VPLANEAHEPPVGLMPSATHWMVGSTPTYPVLHCPTHADPASVLTQLAGQGLALVIETLLGGAVPQPAGWHRGLARTPVKELIQGACIKILGVRCTYLAGFAKEQPS
jgi:hypothetical protein